MSSTVHAGSRPVVLDDSPHRTIQPARGRIANMISRLIEPGPMATLATGQDARLTLKPLPRGDAGYVDGAWWPRSRNLLAEVPSLLREFGTDGGRLERVSYRLADWDPTPRTMGVGTSLIRLGGYRSLAANTVNLLVSGRWLALLVVPPETPERSAERTLGTAGTPDNTDSIAELLADRGQPIPSGP